MNATDRPILGYRFVDTLTDRELRLAMHEAADEKNRIKNAGGEHGLRSRAIRLADERHTIARNELARRHPESF